VAVTACTIVARNYLSAARVLASSFLEHHPDGRFTVLVTDDVDGVVEPPGGACMVKRLADLRVDPGEVLEMAAIYDVMELAVALKPWLLELLLDQVGPDEAVMYLDPDMRVYAPLDEVDALARSFGIVLTPHVTAPMPRDGKMADETVILESGLFNFGFVAVSRAARPFLDFLEERFRRECYVDKPRMRFADQRWVDFAPGAFDAHILRDPAYNVAYWNLDHRPLQRRGNSYVVDGRPLRLFHFSGYRPTVPHLLSKHQGDRPRILLSENAALLGICDDYAAELRRFGYDENLRVEYAFSKSVDGVALDELTRRVYRQALVAHEEDGAERPPNPFDPGMGAHFLAWLNGAPLAGSGGHPSSSSRRRMSRYLAGLYESRIDLRLAFPEAPEDARRMYDWALHEVMAQRLDPRLLPDEPASAVPQDGRQGLRPGIRVVGYLGAESAIGEYGRLLIETARQAGIDVATVVEDDAAPRRARPFLHVERNDLNVNVLCLDVEGLRRLCARAGDDFFGGRYNIAVLGARWDEANSVVEAMPFVDELWVDTTVARDAVASSVSKPVHLMPPPVIDPKVEPGAGHGELELPDGYRFMFACDLSEEVELQNAEMVIETFSTAFHPEEGPLLVIGALGSDRYVNEAERLKYLAHRRPDVLVLDSASDREWRVALTASCNCYVTLGRSAGFDLALTDAMTLGTPVVATASASEPGIVTERTAYVVPFSPSADGSGVGSRVADGTWIEPDLSSAAGVLRHVFEHPDEATSVGARARQHVLSRHGLQARAEQLAVRFGDTQSLLRQSDARGPARTAGEADASGASPSPIPAGLAFGIDLPGDDVLVNARQVEVAGWGMHDGRPLLAVAVTLASADWTRTLLATPCDRPDVCQTFGLSGGEYGWAAVFDLAHAPQDAVVEARATLWPEPAVPPVTLAPRHFRLCSGCGGEERDGTTSVEDDRAHA
jgi:hypothetical protein